MERGDRAAAGRCQLIRLEWRLPQRLVRLKCWIGESLLARAKVDHGRSVGIGRPRHREDAERSAASIWGYLRERGVPAPPAATATSTCLMAMLTVASDSQGECVTGRLALAASWRTCYC